ncbi:potassium channel family protein [Paracoccus marinaquae]|uniref:Potassium channel family protein n=1 Tax=Paracoccus marinaquae TaxID=2841926 RepID=A0ABS6AJK6_9RHOB|nr:potassium channel family protein [Paracoccus marinaquae]MBU3030694.1 potassium channel family protein [Paracoccus marinaquae]
MLGQLTDGIILVALTVAIHSLSLGWSLRQIDRRLREVRELPAGPTILLLSRLAILVIFAHLIEILLWGIYYDWSGVFDGMELSFYFSAVTYATIGYGDIVPPVEWRILASIEGLTGILMCAWSGGFFFAVVSRIHRLD